MSKQFVMMKIVCAQCGEQHDLAEVDDGRKAKCIDGEPTLKSIDKHVIWVEPCKKCFREYQDMNNAICILLEATTRG